MKIMQFSIVLFLLLFGFPLRAQSYEIAPPVLKASNFLKSENHEGEPGVETAGLLNHYKLTSSVSPFEVLDTEMVKMWIRENYAIETLRKKRAPGAAAKGLAQQLKFEAELLGKVITKPVQSAVAIPLSIGSFNRRARKELKSLGFVSVTPFSLTQFEDLSIKFQSQK